MCALVANIAPLLSVRTLRKVGLFALATLSGLGCAKGVEIADGDVSFVSLNPPDAGSADSGADLADDSAPTTSAPSNPSATTPPAPSGAGAAAAGSTPAASTPRTTSTPAAAASDAGVGDAGLVENRPADASG